MWTPKRILLLVGGFIVAVTAYVVYANLLGYVDGLPPLPDALRRASDDPDNPIVPPPDKVYSVDRKLIIAFGEGCPEERRTIKLEVNRNNLIMATDDFIVEDGRVKMTPFSIGIFSKEKDKKDGRASDKDKDGPPEINTIRSDVAYLTFDQPVTSLADIANRKIIAAELRRDPDGRQQGEDAGGVRLVNNRRTLQRDDDLTLFTPGPVFYQEKQGSEPDKEPHIWTAEAVRIRDEQSKPSPTEVVAIGMDVYLLAEEPVKKKEPRGPPPAASSNNKPIGINGVKSIRLRSDVDMYLWIDSQAGFLGDGGKKPKPAEANAEPPAKAQLQIKTQGPFFYNVLTDQARFDISQHPGPYPNNVVVRRTHVPDTACDQLICDHLEIQFQRKSARDPDADAGKADSRAVNLEIQTAHGWGTQVTLTSDHEGLTAFGNDLTYNAITKETLLKGSPEMVAMKDGNEIYARELLTITSEDGTQNARAKGPGHLRIFDRATDQRTLRARWSDTLISGKDGNLDVLTLTGDAEFEDQLHGQVLKADRLKVWLLPAEPPPPGQEKGEGQKRRPHQLEAIGNVLARSADMHVHDTDRLVVWFKDGQPTLSEPNSTLTAKPTTDAPAGASAAPNGPAPRPAEPAAPTVPSNPSTAPAPAGNPVNPSTAPTAGGTPPATETTPAKPKRPVDLSARSVVAHVVRVGPKNELEKLWCEGAVRVQQAPETPDAKGTDIHGQTLELHSFPEGHVLTVTGAPAEVQLDKLTIIGPEIHIDQKENKTTVHGDGVMKMPSQTSFQGGALKEPTLLTIYWNREMFFDGLYASFYGGVQAEQLEARLTCQNMQVRLDRMVSLKQGQKNDPPAKVSDLVCDQSVRIQDSTYQDKKLIRFSQIDSPTMSVDNGNAVVTAPGPGVVRILQPGVKSEPTNRPANAPATPPPAAEELKLTYIHYMGRMLANNNTRTAVFYENVELVHVPSDNPNLVVDIDKLPEGAFYMRCDLLNVYQRRESAEKTYQQMEARGRSVVQAREFWGRADIIKFDESKDLVIFEAAEGNLATLYRQRARGQAPEEVKGKKIYYWRRTNDFKIEGGTRLESH